MAGCVRGRGERSGRGGVSYPEAPTQGAGAAVLSERSVRETQHRAGVLGPGGWGWAVLPVLPRGLVRPPLASDGWFFLSGPAGEVAACKGVSLLFPDPL